MEILCMIWYNVDVLDIGHFSKMNMDNQSEILSVFLYEALHQIWCWSSTWKYTGNSPNEMWPISRQPTSVIIKKEGLKHITIIMSSNLCLYVAWVEGIVIYNLIKLNGNLNNVTGIGFSI